MLYFAILFFLFTKILSRIYPKKIGALALSVFCVTQVSIVVILNHFSMYAVALLYVCVHMAAIKEASFL
ncbi:hypothetical protein BDC45DRAFT_514390 [Circinella umbellata]|nr:hypothetical protein BDC45DRAFT_514390 [Circinella umbellata]